jgi:hypothetical protein
VVVAPAVPVLLLIMEEVVEEPVVCYKAPWSHLWVVFTPLLLELVEQPLLTKEVVEVRRV